MANRPIFIPSIDGPRLVEEANFDFKWNAGMAPSQKKKNILALHEAAIAKGAGRILEVSTKSGEQLGWKLSAFNLKVETESSGMIPLEAAFQGSKVFRDGGPYTDLYRRQGFDIKKDPRLKESGNLRGFQFEGDKWELEPKTAFYDWLYVHALHRDYDLRTEVCLYDAFSDIEFNPKKSINCQARSCALYVALSRREILVEALADRKEFLWLLNSDSFFQSHSIEKRQGELF